MSLRTRLTCAFMLLVAAPLATAGVLLGLSLPGQTADRTQARAVLARDFVRNQLHVSCQTATDAAANGARAAAVPAASVRAALASADVVLLLDAHKRPVASGVRTGLSDDALAALRTVGECQLSNADPWLVVSTARLTDRHGTVTGTVTAGVVIDDAWWTGGGRHWLSSRAHLAGAQLTTVVPGRSNPVLASTLPSAGAARVARVVMADPRVVTGVVAHGGSFLAALPLRSAAQLVVEVPIASTAGSQLLILLAVLGGTAVAGLLAIQLSRLLTRPISELDAAAARVAGGDLSTRIPVRSQDEVGRLAEAFNNMTGDLQDYVGALEHSRDELRRNVARLGDTLSSTHDLGRILAVILETAMSSVDAHAGALLLTATGSHELYLTVGRGLETRLGSASTDGPGSVRVQVGDGSIGATARVAATGEALCAVVGSGPGEVVLADDEPQARTVISVPMRTGGRITGVLNLYDRADGQPFQPADLDTIRTFAGQATVAIDNVLLHQEAQRLSITDGLTGLWNYRYLTMALSREVERAVRFERPVSVLMLDLDRFKTVNDVYGHQRGDAVLVEVTNRVRQVIREVDVLARYGGEEFVLVLPETDVEGAELLAARIRDSVGARPFGVPGEEPVGVTTSVGIAVWPRHGETANALLRAADAALYAAKSGGRDCWRVAPTAGASSRADGASAGG